MFAYAYSSYNAWISWEHTHTSCVESFYSGTKCKFIGWLYKDSSVYHLKWNMAALTN